MDTPRAAVLDGAWRLLPTTTLDAASHLARAQVLLEAVGAGRAPNTLACERWRAPALILGAAQQAADLDRAACARRDVAVVRRLAGGGAVYATVDYLSFIIAVHATHPLVRGDIFTAYARFGALVHDALASLDVPARLLGVEEARARHTPPALRPCCYGGLSPYEILVGERKLVGVAQVRRFGAVGYVGGLYRSFDPVDQAAYLAGDAALRAERAALLASHVTDLTVLDRPSAFAAFPHALATTLQARLGLRLAVEELSPAELDRAARLRVERYTNDAWTFRR